MIDLGSNLAWIAVTLFSIWAIPEVIKPLFGYMLTSLFSLAVGVYWWLTSQIIKELWDTT